MPGTSELLSLYNNIATTHYVIGEMDQALHYYNEIHRLEQEELCSLSISTHDNISDLAKSALSTLQNIARVYIALQYLRKVSAFSLEHKELIGDKDRHSLYSSFGMYYSNCGMLHNDSTSKSDAPTA